jgi:hypothetical protein
MIRDVHSGSGILNLYDCPTKHYSDPDLLQTEPEPNKKIHFQLQKKLKI